MKALAPHESILPDFLAYFLESSSERVLSQCVKRGATVHSIDIGRLEQLPVPVPTKSEQRRIVDVLDEAVELYKRRADADVKSARILPALFEEMFGDPVANPRRWPTAPLEEVVEIGTQLVDPNRAQYLDVLHIGGEQIEKDSGRILSPSLVRHSDLRSGKFLFTAEHVLYSKIRPYLNKVAYPRFNGVCSADIYPLRAKDGRLSPWYLVALLRSRAFLDYAKLHSGRLRMAKLNREQLGSFKVPLPEPSLREAFEALAVRLAELEPERLQIRDKMDQLFQVLLHGAFAGELTANWRQARSKELLVEMEHQAKVLNLPREALLC
jgi:type I restriction enzyme S subunit